MELVYKEYGVQSHRPCPDCLKWMVLYVEMGLAYYLCRDPDCEGLEVASSEVAQQYHSHLPSYLEDNDTVERRDLPRCVMSVSIFLAERMEAEAAREGRLSFTTWAKRVNDEIGDELEALGSRPELLPRVWNSNIMQLIRSDVERYARKLRKWKKST